MNRYKSKSPGPPLVVQKALNIQKMQKPSRSQTPPRKQKSPSVPKDSSGKGKNKYREKALAKQQKKIEDTNNLLEKDVQDLSKEVMQSLSNLPSKNGEITKEMLMNKRKAVSTPGETADFMGFVDAEDTQKAADEAIEGAFSKTKKLKSEGNSRDDRRNFGSSRDRDDRDNRNDYDNYVRFDEEIKLAPWMTRNTYKVRNTLVRMHNEIIDFVNYVAPKDEDHNRREEAFKRLSKIIQEIFPSSKILPFGSFATKMYLPNADIDLVLLEPNTNSVVLMNKLAKILLKDDRFEDVNVIRSAKVPLIKLVEVSTGYNFDISFNKLDGVKQIKEIHKGMTYYPEMRYITILFKCFLKQRDLNETYTGGIEIKRDYISQERERDIPNILLSEYLLKFLDFYANFDITSKQIIIAEGGGIVDKYVKESSLSVISPQEATHDVGGACFKAREVFGVFKNRYNFLMNYNFKEGESALKYLINADLI